MRCIIVQLSHGDCDAVIAKAAAAVTHVQSLSQEVGSGNEGLGLFGFDLSSEKTGFWWLGEEQEQESKPIHGIDLGTWLQKKLEKLSAAPDELTMLAEKRKTSPPIFVFHMIYSISVHHGSGQARVFSMHPRRRWLCLLGSRANIYTLQGRRSRLISDSAVHTYFGRASFLVGETAEVVPPSATSTEFDFI